MREIDPIPHRSNLDSVYLHIYYGCGDAHRVINQVIDEIYEGSGTYRLCPPASYPDPAYAFSTLDLYVEDAVTGARFIGVYTLEPISGILTLLSGEESVSGIATGAGTSNYIEDAGQDFVDLGVEEGDTIKIIHNPGPFQTTEITEVTGVAPTMIRVKPMDTPCTAGDIYIIYVGPIAGYPPQIRVSYRYYSGFISTRAKNLDPTWPSAEGSTADIYGQQVYTLQDKFPLRLKFELYGAALDIIKEYFRESVRTNKFVLIVDDNICDKTFDTARPWLFRPGWAAEGPLFCNEIDLVDRGGPAYVTFTQQIHQYGDYYWHTSITPHDRWWPQEQYDTWGWDYMDNLLTPPVGYAWPPDDWWEVPVGEITGSDFVYTYDDLEIDASLYDGIDIPIRFIISSIAGPDKFDWDYFLGGIWNHGDDFVMISTTGWYTITYAGHSFKWRFSNTVGHTVNQTWTFNLKSDGTYNSLFFNGDNIHYDADLYTGTSGRTYAIRITTTGVVGVAIFTLYHKDPGDAVFGLDAAGLTTANPFNNTLLEGLELQFTGSIYYADAVPDDCSFFSVTVLTNAPIGLPAIPIPPGGWIIWKSNIPVP